MMKLLSLSHVVRWLDKRTMKAGFTTQRSGKWAGLFCLAMSLFLMSIFFSACSNPFAGNAPATPTSATQGLNQISWCTKQLMVFRDEGAVTPTATPTATATATSTPATATANATVTTTATQAPGPGTPTTITDWSEVKANLGFTVYLPTSLPHGSCLVSAQATIHDPIFGGSFTIGYLLPDHTSLSISEAPLKSQNATFQCNTPATPTSSGTPATAPTASSTPNQLCSGAKDTTNVVISGPGTVEHLQQTFDGLQPNVNWIPAS